MTIKTPWGKMFPIFNAQGQLTHLMWQEEAGYKKGPQTSVFENNLQQQLSAYFLGESKSLNIPITFTTGTPLQQKVWHELMKIPYGETLSYTELAERVGSHPRPVANAVGKNPCPILIPCHRVLAKNSIGGYTAPLGLEMKKELLKIEHIEQ